MNFKTEQEAFWNGEFGDEYSDRNTGTAWISSNCAFFGRVLERTREIESVIEFGPNIGLNLLALNTLLPNSSLSGVELNEKAAAKLAASLPDATLHVGSLLEFEPTRIYDFAFTKGVLIHIDPNQLERAYDALYKSSSRYIMISEYYNPAPVEVEYRGHSGKLFKRDFAGEMLERYSDLTLIDYGFVYRRDPIFPQDDMNWFLLEKKALI